MNYMMSMGLAPQALIFKRVKPLVAILLACFATASLAEPDISGNNSNGVLSVDSVQNPAEADYWIAGWYKTEGGAQNADVSIANVHLTDSTSRMIGAMSNDTTDTTTYESIQLTGNHLKLVNSSARLVQAAWSQAFSSELKQVTLANNTAEISSVTTQDPDHYMEIHGAYGGSSPVSSSPNFVLTDNHVIVSGVKSLGTVEIKGAYAYTTSGTIQASGNTASISNSTLSSGGQPIVGAWLSTDGSAMTATNNAVIVDNSTITTGYLAGAGFGTLSTAITTSGNMVRLVDATVNGRVYGAYSMELGGIDSRNEIVAQGVNQATSIGGFETLTLLVDADANANAPVLSVSEAVDFSDRTIVVRQADGADGYDPSAEYYLLASEEAITGLDDKTVRFEGTWTTAQADLVFDGSTLKVNAAEAAAGNEDSKTLTESFLGSLALVQQGAEFIADEGMAAMDRTAAEGAWTSFGSMQGGTSRYDTGSRVDLDAVTLAAGAATKVSGTLLAGFVEAGWGSSESHVRAADADGDHNYYGVGVALRRFVGDAFYVDGSVRAGWASTEFDGQYAAHQATYDADGFYGSAHVAAGCVAKLGGGLSADFYGRYTLTYLEGDDLRLNDEGRNRFDTDNAVTHAFRLGARLSGQYGEVSSWRAGLAYEHVADGDAEGKLQNVALSVPSLEGNTFIAEAGWSTKPSASSPWSFDFGIKGYAGDREGVSGSAILNYAF